MHIGDYGEDDGLVVYMTKTEIAEMGRRFDQYKTTLLQTLTRVLSDAKVAQSFKDTFKARVEAWIARAALLMSKVAKTDATQMKSDANDLYTEANQLLDGVVASKPSASPWPYVIGLGLVGALVLGRK